MLNINKEINEGIAKYALEGRLDTNTAPELEADLREVFDQLTELLFDCEKLEYISSAGLRVLLAAQKVMSAQGVMKLTNVGDEIMDIFDVTGFSDILTIE